MTFYSSQKIHEIEGDMKGVSAVKDLKSIERVSDNEFVVCLTMMCSASAVPLSCKFGHLIF